MHQNIEIALMKTQSRAFRTSDGAEGSPSNRTMNLSTQQEWLIDNCECLWVAQPEPNEIFMEKPENVRLPPSNLKELERWGEEWQIIAKQTNKQTKKTWGCKGTSAKHLVKGMSTYAMYLFEFFYL